MLFTHLHLLGCVPDRRCDWSSVDVDYLIRGCVGLKSRVVPVVHHLGLWLFILTLVTNCSQYLESVEVH